MLDQKVVQVAPHQIAEQACIVVGDLYSFVQIKTMPNAAASRR
jgi:hypothetical protein